MTIGFSRFFYSTLAVFAFVALHGVGRAQQSTALVIQGGVLIDGTGRTPLARLNRLSDHKELKIYAGGGADYAMAASFLKSHREEAKKFMAGICQGIALARSDKARALPFVAKSGRDLDTAAVEYLYNLYVNDVIPPKPYLKTEGIELALQMTASSIPAAQAIKLEELTDRSLVPELEKQGRCNF